MITNTTAKSTYTIAEGVTTYAIGFQYALNPDGSPQIQLYLNNHPESPLVYLTDYTLSGDGLSIVLTGSSYEVGDRLNILRNIPNVQLSDYHVGRIDPEQIEHDFDEAVMRDQQLQAEIDLLGELPIDHETRITAIEEKIPSEATPENQLADKAYVDAADSDLQGQIDALTIDDLADVDTSSVQDGQVLVYDEDTNKWVPQTTAAASFSTISGSPYDNAALSRELDVKTNCVTNIPEDIKFELDNGTLTLKAGSKIYVPNGFELDGTTAKYDEIIVANDISDTFSGIDNQSYLITYRTDNNTMNAILLGGNRIKSGTSFPVSPLTGYIFYRTDENKIYRYSGATWENILSFPLAIITGKILGDGVKSVEKVFNGFGYIGSVIYSLPGVKVLIPNFRNTDGTLNNIEKELQDVWVVETDSNVAVYNFGVLNSGGLYVQNVQVERYDNKNNIIKWADNAVICCICGTFVKTSGNRITSFNSKTAFQAVDYNNTEFIGHQAMPSQNDIALTLSSSGIGYTAPADGIFSIILNAGSSAWCNMYINSKKVSVFGADSGSYYNGYFAVSKGDVFLLEYADCTANTFRFIYTNGTAEWDKLSG